ncbi:MAG: RloB family protein [Aliidongia sp.]
MKGSRSLKRPVGTRLPKRKFIIYTEGKNTEPDYFRALERGVTGALVAVEIVDAAGVPTTIAEKACLRAKKIKKGRSKRSSFEEDDRVWAVFDRDEHLKVNEAIQKCYSNSVGIAFSNPCFELWLILHHTDFDRPDDRHGVQAHFASICSDYDRSGPKTTDCTRLMPLVKSAEARAERQLQRRREEGNPPSPPFTTVYLLTREMREASEAHLA